MNLLTNMDVMVMVIGTKV